MIVQTKLRTQQLDEHTSQKRKEAKGSYIKREKMQQNESRRKKGRERDAGGRVWSANNKKRN